MILAAQLFGRLHPLIVHLPIGILLLAALFEVLSYFKNYRSLRQAVAPTLLIGALFAVLAAATGYVLAQEGGYDDRILAIHRNTGIATAIFACILVVIRKSVVTYFDDKETRKLVRIFLFLPLVVLLSLAGHLGGSLTHGEDYLFAFTAEDTSAAPAIKLTSTVNLDSAKLYQDVIQPILKSRCYGCHSATKQKGQLRLDQPDYILKGGKHGSVLDGIVTDSSALYARLMLPLEEEKHMPPNEKPQLTSSEIALIHGWINGGASFDKVIGEFKESSKIKGFIHSLIDLSTASAIIPEKEVTPATPIALDALAAQKILVIPVGAGTNYLSASFVNARSLGDAELKLLLPIKDQLIWLNLGRTKITDAGVDVVAQLSGVNQLNLEYTSVSDQGIEKLKTLTSLNSLNLVGTNITDAGLSRLVEIKSLKKVFLYQTQVTANGVKDLLQQAPHIMPDTGSYILPARVTDTLVFKPNRIQ
ncbi:MAG: DUF2231 domain-containing protein [Chryseolinea sp.]